MKAMKIFSNKWFFIFVLITVMLTWLIIVLPFGYNPPQPSFYERFTDRTQYYLKELIGYNSQIYSVIIDEVESDLNGFYLAISFVGLSVIILTLQIIAAITRLPIGYLAYPGKFLVIKKSNIAQQLLEVKTEKETEK